jgi:hypothetical protein
MDDLCLRAELATSSSDYAYIICNGMENLLRTNVEVEKIKSHKNLFLKILYLGKDLMECSTLKSELFYLGTLIELKILDKWTDFKFYIFLLKAIKRIEKNIFFLSEKIKEKLVNELISFNSSLYYRYFIEIKTAT